MCANGCANVLTSLLVSIKQCDFVHLLACVGRHLCVQLCVAGAYSSYSVESLGEEDAHPSLP